MRYRSSTLIIMYMYLLMVVIQRGEIMNERCISRMPPMTILYYIVYILSLARDSRCDSLDDLCIGGNWMKIMCTLDFSQSTKLKKKYKNGAEMK